MLDTLQIAKSWLHECTQDHSQWQCANQDSDMLPTRLVCIANPCPRLVSTCHWTARPRYATLSHCWGDIPFLRLETRNQDAFSRIIPSDQLPKTFQDAIEIAKALGLEYIWIDSLCIVQDDDDDWRKEAALMSSVYGGSHVTMQRLPPPVLTKGVTREQTGSWTAYRWRFTYKERGVNSR